MAEHTERALCYECTYRRELPFSCHSKCVHPLIKEKGPIKASDLLGIRAESHGIRNGWFRWPYDFDPIWLISCDGFKEKEEHEHKA